MPKKTFTAGEVLRAADVNEYLSTSRNVIINGAFDIWQRGTSGTGSNGFFFVADRWISYAYASNSTTISRQSFTAGSAPVAGYESQYFLRINATNTQTFIQQNIEDVRSFAGQSITVSFWAKGASGANLSVGLAQGFGAGGSSTVNQSIGSTTITNAWVRYSFSTTVPAISGKTIGDSSYLGINITSTTLNQNLDLWGVQVEEGSTATPFARNANSIQGELAACQRYFFAGGAGASGRWVNTTTAEVGINFPVTMRTAPSISHSANYIAYRLGLGSVTVTNSTSGGFGPTGGNIVLTSSGANSGEGAIIPSTQNVWFNSEL